MHEELVRTFVAVELPRDVKASLGRIQAELNKRIASSLGADAASRALKWVDPEGIHLTLKFLGSMPASCLGDVQDALQRATADKSSLTIQLADLGAFPSVTRPRVLWIGARGETEKLAQIQAQVDSELARIGFPREERAFSPHITLARLRETASPNERRKIGEAIEAGLRVPSVVVPVNSISLMRSQLTRAGALYSRIAEIALQPAS